ncbi:MAG: c-type cytochrome biogenesis protein CcmF [Gammaproteobacteria bacterium]|nr:heme lyase CcmF/NrfE family subunit [Gammaproteobacteria bacterium]PCH64686.1 MAG: c-type cytochrome biogenesis protein CcmF [Gammaproteobacteria bacterium]
MSAESLLPEIGHYSLILALGIALAQGYISLVGAQQGKAAWIAFARPSARAQFGLVFIAFVCLAWGFVTDDFSIRYVAEHSNSLMPTEFKFAAVWGGHEGSLLLWMLMLSGWTLAVSIWSRQLPDEMVARVLGVLGLLSVGFLMFILFTSNPFERLFPAAIEGRDLNPLLQDFGLIIHPPMLYMGYVGFSVAFAFAISALISGRLDVTWVRWSRPWTTIAWAFLTVGIALGSWWAYYELGWGGWWFWDPVENASFMPWLVGTALIHSLAVSEKRGSFKSWTILLAIFAFSLSLLGTFLVRSGVLVSVHAFATDPTRGIYVVSFLGVVVTSSLLLYAWRAGSVGMGGKFDAVSRETSLLANNIVMVVAALAILLGTLYPLIGDAFGYKVSVGPPFFNAIFVPLMAAAVVVMGLGPLMRWKRDSAIELAQRVKIAALVSFVVALFLPFTLDGFSLGASFGLLLSFWIFSTAAFGIWGRLAKRSFEGSLVKRVAALGRSYWGQQVAHIGFAASIVGVTMVTYYEVERDVRMDIGDTVDARGYTFRFDGVVDVQGPNYVAKRGIIQVLNDEGEPVRELHPEKRVYTVQTMPMTEAAIHTNLLRDLYVSLGEPVSGGAWSVRVYYKPFIVWLWGGAALMGLGGFLAVSDRRYRVRSKKEAIEKDKASSTTAGVATEGAMSFESKS